MIERLKEELGLPSLVARILISRGIESPEEAEKFLYPDLRDLSDPFLLPDMDLAVGRVIRALMNKERICIYSDYDADGVTSAAIMLNFLKELKIDVDYYIPTRDEGYGLNGEAVKEISKKNIRLLFTLDCGSTNFDEIALAKSFGIDTIVIDHHEVKESHPPSYAFVNPKRKDSVFPTPDLAACGVTFFFLIALRRELVRNGIIDSQINLRKELDLVALGTIGDMVPLVRDNRIITKFGIEAMRKKPRQWLKSFYLTKTLPQKRLDDYQLSFIVVPRINAPGRISDAEKSLKFLIEKDPEASIMLLEELNEANRKRQAIEENILKEIENFLSEREITEKKAFVLYNESWHVGVIGIVAQRIAEQYGKPTIVLTSVDGVIRGSGRGVEGLDLHKSLSAISHLLIRYGGHKYACGLSLSSDKLEPFSQAFEMAVRSFPYEKAKVSFDTEADFDELTREAIEALELLGPFGYGNPHPRILLFPESILDLGGRLKIIDKRKRVWYGSIQRSLGGIPEKVSGIVVTPYVKEEIGEEFVNLLVRGVI